MPPRWLSTRFMLSLIAVVIGMGVMERCGLDIMGLYSAPLLAVALWSYLWFRQMQAGGLSPRDDDEIPPDSEPVTPGRSSRQRRLRSWRCKYRTRTRSTSSSFFVLFLHQFLARELPGRRGLQDESRRTQDGWVSYVDSRVLDAPRPAAGREPDDEDVICRFRVRGGLIEL